MTRRSLLLYWTKALAESVRFERRPNAEPGHVRRENAVGDVHAVVEVVEGEGEVRVGRPDRGQLGAGPRAAEVAAAQQSRLQPKRRPGRRGVARLSAAEVVASRAGIATSPTEKPFNSCSRATSAPSATVAPERKSASHASVWVCVSQPALLRINDELGPVDQFVVLDGAGRPGEPRVAKPLPVACDPLPNQEADTRIEVRPDGLERGAVVEALPDTPPHHDGGQEAFPETALRLGAVR